MDEPKVEYPCWWTYALIGPDEEAIRLLIGTVTRGLEHKVEFSKNSKDKRYVSLHVDVWVVSEAQRDEVFLKFKADPNIRMVL